MNKVNVLVFAADPLSTLPQGRTRRLWLDEEVREIRQKVRAAEHRDAVEFDIRWAPRTDDLLQALNERPPQVVHFSGHGGTEGLVLVGADGHSPHRVDAAVLRQLFVVFRGDIRVVVLSACFSLPQAEAIATAVGCAIGTGGTISDEAAVTFNAAFYRAIAFGHSVQAAYEQARLALRLEHVAASECPEMRVAPGVDPAALVLVRNEGIVSGGRGEDGVAPEAVDEIARRARAGDLRPKILERVARPFVEAEYVPLIRKLQSVDRRALAIVGDAGYGKTTMLGEIYDRLAEAGVSWTGVLSCADVFADRPATPDDLARRMGKLVSGAEVPLPAVCARMNEARGRGVLLVDTLDLLLGGSLDRGVDRVLSEVAEAGTTVVLTCREYEFAQFATPGPTRAGPRLGFALRGAPPFTDEEVRAAAERYVELHEGGDADAGRGFADGLLTLSAGSYRLEQIVRNPLLLALLCELFATEGYAVPADLTVSTLYEVYWDARVEDSRKHRGTPVALRKSALCREIAANLLHASRDHVKTRIRRDDLPLTATQVDTDALKELLSDGILREGAGGSVEFFHQTFLEYAMARWLNSAAHQAERRELLRRTREGGGSALHLWPIVRQVLTTADPDDFAGLASELDLADAMAFKTVALSAVAAEQLAVLERLQAVARQRGPGFRDALLFALRSAPRAMLPAAWRAALGLMEGESYGVAIQVAKPLAGLLGQMEGSPAARVEEAVSAFLRLDDDDGGEEGASVAIGMLMKHLEGPLSRGADGDTLALLRQHFGVLGHEGRTMVIMLHVRRGDAGARARLVRQVTEAELPAGMVPPLMELMRAVALDRTPESDDALAPLRRLEEPLPEGWVLVQARLAGWEAVHDEGRLRILVERLLAGDPRFLEKVYLALRIAIESGAGRQVAELLTREPVSSVPQNRRHAISRLLGESSSALGRRERRRVSDWLLHAEPLPDELLAALAAVADQARARERVCSGIGGLAARRRYQFVARIVGGLPVAFGRALMDAATRAPVQRGDEADWETMQAAWFHRLAADGDDGALHGLIRLAAGERRKAALRGAESIAALSSERPLPMDALLAMAASRYPGVRTAPLRAAWGQLDRGWPVTEEALDSFAAAYAGETNTAVLAPYFSLVAKWVEVHRRVPRRPAEVAAAIPASLRAAGGFDRGMARGVAHVLKVMAQAGDPESLPRVEAWTLDLFASLDARLMNGSQASMSELLVQLAQADPTFLERALDRAPGLPPRNIRVLAKTIKRTLGPSSPLLARIATAEWCPPEVRQVVLGFQGT